MPIPFSFDFKKPDYLEVFKWREERLRKIRQDTSVLPALRLFYKNNPAQFIIDWGMTSDPRNPERGLPTVCPFLLFPKQEEAVYWIIDHWKTQKPGVIPKSREEGLTWLAVSLSATLCLFYEGLAIGFGSRKEEYVDKLGDPKCILYKARQFISLLPIEFRGSWDAKKHAPHMRIQFPETGSVISGEAGDGIGRGDRKSIYFVDEAAWLSRPDLVEASLSQTTNCRIDISTPRGMNNPFARKVHSGKIDVFMLSWRDDPRKDQAWYEKKCNDIDDPVVIAQEIDADFSASMEGVVIPAEWVRSAIDAHIKLGIKPSGKRVIGLDVADQGKDLNAACGRHGILIDYLSAWSGKGGDIYATTEKACTICDENNHDEIVYDADGLGAGVRGDARKVNEKRKVDKKNKITFNPFRGSGAVINPDKEVYPKSPGESSEKSMGRTNEDFFVNAKSQAWWYLRRRFLLTHRAITQGCLNDINSDDIISISSAIPDLQKLISELSQPTYSENNVGKILIDKAPDGSASPNRADAVMIAFAPIAIRVSMFDV